MKSLLSASLALLVCVAASAADPKPLDPKLDRAVRDAVPNCKDLTLTASDMPFKLPARFQGHVVRIESPSHGCDGQLVAATSPTGGIYIGSPWPIANEEGATIEEKLKNFAWRAMEQNAVATVDRTARTPDGLLKATITSTTAAGKVPLKGEVDPEGTVFFFGGFRRDIKAERQKAFEPFLKNSPAKGAANPVVTIVEFSDFECPSCKRAADYLDPILAKHGDKVRYIRYDLPLSGHPWAFPAAMAGRAIYRQKPELFWTYKKEVYANQDKLMAFTFDDFARGFITSNELDMKRYEADVTSETIQAELLSGVGTAFSNDVRSTPSYLVNGTFVEAGEGGKGLMEYVESLLR